MGGILWKEGYAGARELPYRWWWAVGCCTTPPQQAAPRGMRWLTKPPNGGARRQCAAPPLDSESPPEALTCGRSVILMRDAIWLPTTPPAVRLPMTWGGGGGMSAHCACIACEIDASELAELIQFSALSKQSTVEAKHRGSTAHAKLSTETQHIHTARKARRRGTQTPQHGTHSAASRHAKHSDTAHKARKAHAPVHRSWRRRPCPPAWPPRRPSRR